MNSRGSRFAGTGRSAPAGFTLLELITVMLVLGILAIFATARFDLDPYREAGFYQQSATAVRYAQKLAVSSECDVRVRISSGGCLLNWGACGAATGNAILNPASEQADFCGDGTATVSPAADFTFDRIGQPVATGAPTTLLAQQNFTIGARTLRVEPVTGYVHEP